MVFKKCNPGCACCKDNECLIPVDGWNEIYGEWYSALHTHQTDDSNALLITTNEHKDFLSRHVVIANIKGENDGDILRLIVAYQDGSNYLFGEVEFGNTEGYLRLFRVTSGSKFQIGSTLTIPDLPPGYYRQLQVCYDGLILIARIETTSAIKSLHGSVYTNGTKVGIATGDIHSSASFNHFEWYDHYSFGDYYNEPNNCPKCQHPLACQFCGGTVPMYYAVTISNIKDQHCSNCADLNGTYFIPLYNISEIYCWWNRYYSDISHSCGDRIIIGLRHAEYYLGGYETIVSFNLYSGGWNLTDLKVSIDWKLIGTQLINCDSNNLNIPFYGQEYFMIDGMGATYCEGSDSTCIIGAIT